MALIKCKECGKEISSLANVCPNCGCPIKTDTQQNQGSNFVLDNTGNNYLEMAQSALIADNYDEAIRYANKLIERNTNDYEAWLIKGKATLLSGTVANTRFKEAIYCFNNILSKKSDAFLLRCDIVSSILSVYENFQARIEGNKKGAISQALINGVIDTISGTDLAQENINERNTNISVVEQLKNEFSAYVIPFIDTYNLKWEINLFLSKRPIGNTEEEIERNIERIKEDITNGNIEDFYQNFLNQIQPKKGGCYIATAVYSSYDCPEVWVLRRFRDFCLLRNTVGQGFVKFYYTTSPALVKKFGKNKIFTSFWKNILDKFVSFLKDKGFSDQPYND